MSLTASDFIALLPILVMATASVATMLAIAFFRHPVTAVGLCVGGCAATLGSIPAASTVTPRTVTTLLIVDGFGLFYSGLIVMATAIVALLSASYLRPQGSEGEEVEEFYVLLLLAALGALVVVAASHFVSFFLGLELIGISLYGLIAYLRTERKPIEAAIKYLVLSATSSAFLLFGMALIYFETGTMEFARIMSAMTATEAAGLLFLTGTGMMLTALGFKLAVAPFHMWTPDVYEGAPAPVTAFIATVSKGAIFALLLRYFVQVNGLQHRALWVIIVMIAVGSMFVGNLLALLQNNVKRVLAYSSIAHLGYLLVAFLASGPLAIEAVTFYLVAYFITTLGAFGVVTVLSQPGQEADAMEGYRGLFWRRPWLGASFTLMLLSLAGIPLTAGFVGKFYLIAAGVDARLWVPVIMLVLNSVIGIFYYLRIIIVMAGEPIAVPPRPVVPTIGPAWVGSLSLTALTLLLLGVGTYPYPLIAWIQSIVAIFG